ncbi:MAG: hypothetical protein PHF79_00510 [Candidatus Pacebacteria bacterium]|nr:hypothetical protein [Candidatus Paceibacterota bacterium]
MRILVLLVTLAIVFVLSTVVVTVLTGLGLPAGNAAIAGMLGGGIVTILAFLAMWKVFLVEVPTQKVFVTIDRWHGGNNFYLSGVHVKYPWEDKLNATDDPQWKTRLEDEPGEISLNKHILIESPKKEYTTIIDNSVVVLDFYTQFSVRQDIRGPINPRTLSAWILTSITAKKAAALATIDAVLTRMTTQNTSEWFREHTDDVSTQLASVFGGKAHESVVETRHGMDVDDPQFQSVTDSAQVQKARQKVKEAEMFRKRVGEIMKNGGIQDVEKATRIALIMGEEAKGEYIELIIGGLPKNLRDMVINAPITRGTGGNKPQGGGGGK